MSSLTLVSLVVFAFWFTTSESLTCDPDSRYPHPLNCSAFILCDKHSNPNTFHCPEGLHFNPKRSHCDWPDNAGCPLGIEESAGDHGSQWETSGDNKTTEVNEHSLEVDILEKLHGVSVPHNNENTDRVEATQKNISHNRIVGLETATSNDSLSKEENSYEDKEKNEGISYETTTFVPTGENEDADEEVSSKETYDKKETPNGNESINSTDKEPEKNKEDLEFSDLTKESLHPITRGEEVAGVEKDEVNGEETFETSNYNAKAGELGEINNDTSTSNKNSQSIETYSDTDPSDAKEPEINNENDPEVPIVTKNITLAFIPVGFNLTFGNFGDNLGYEMHVASGVNSSSVTVPVNITIDTTPLGPTTQSAIDSNGNIYGTR